MENMFRVIKTSYGNMEFELHEGERVVGSRVRFGKLPEVDFSKAVCVHHDDLDGRMAAQELYEMGVRSFVEVDYGSNAIEKDEQLFSIFGGSPETVFVVDYSLTEKSLIILMNNIKLLHPGCHLIWMDHHASSFRVVSKVIEEYSDLIESGDVYIDINNNRSGAAIVHDNYVQKFHGLGMSDRCIELVDDYDRWVGLYPKSTCLNMYMFTSSSMRVGEQLMHDVLYDIDGALDKAISYGTRLMEVAKLKNEIVYEAFSYEKEVHSLKCRILVGFGNSLVFGDHIKEYDAVIIMHMDKDKKWAFSMYTDKSNIDCSEICSKYYGGGGHRKAAGGSSLERPF